MRFLAQLLFLTILFEIGGPASVAQTNESRERYRERYNESVIYLMGGQPGGAFAGLAADIASVVNADGRIRVLPVSGGAGAQNINDLVMLRGIDLALVHLNVLNEFKTTNELGPNLEKQISIIANLMPLEAHLLVRPGIANMADLRGKKVNFNNKGSGTAYFAPRLFKELAVDVVSINLSQSDAIDLMKRGEVDATLCVCSKPQAGLPAIAEADGFRLLPIPYTAAYEADFLPASITSEDYPNLIPKGERIETIATSAILATFNWPKGSTRYERTARFVDVFYSKVSELHKPPRHPAWKSMNLAASVPGWARFPAAEALVEKMKAGQHGAEPVKLGN
jgi:uncharacterized protein